jgi:hypothetical protein
MPLNPLVDLLAELPRDNDLAGSTVTKSHIPPTVRCGLDTWLSEVNITFKDLDDEVQKASYFDDEREYYCFTFNVEGAEVFVGTVIIQEDQVLGESSQVSS